MSSHPRNFAPNVSSDAANARLKSTRTRVPTVVDERATACSPTIGDDYRTRDCDLNLVLLDTRLRDLDGCDVARALRKGSSRNVPCIAAMSGLARSQDRERARRAGIDEYLVDRAMSGTSRAAEEDRSASRASASAPAHSS